MAKATAAQTAQFGVEEIAGTAVPATIRPTSGTLTISDKRETGTIQPSGALLPSKAYQKYENTEGTFEGVPCYRELKPLLDWALGTPTATELEPGAYRYAYDIVPSRSTRTVEFGDASHASRAAGVFVTGITLDWGANSGDASVKLDLVGGKLVDSITLAEDTIASDALVISAASVRVYVDATEEALGTTLLDETLKTTLALTDLGSQVRYLGGATGQVSTAITGKLDLVAEATTRVRELRAIDQVRYVRIEASGTELPGVTYGARLTIDLAVQTTEHSRGDADAVYATTLGMAVIDNGFAPRATLITDAV